MIVYNRSNDSILGATGANQVHMGILQEYMAVGIGCDIGKYWQVSSNMHAYLRDFEKMQDIAERAGDPYRTQNDCPYIKGIVDTTPIVDLPIKEWDHDLHLWMNDPFRVGIQSKFFTRVATPMYAAHMAYRKKDYDGAIEIIETQMPDKLDWKIASLQWLNTRKAAHNKKE